MSTPTTRLEKKRQRDAQATEGIFTKVFGRLKVYNQRPFPWCLLPDGAWFAMGLVSLLCISVPCLSLILLTTISGELIRMWMRTEAGGKQYAAMRDTIHGWSYAVAKKIMIDPRNHSYLPWTVFETIAMPILAYFAWKRHMANGFEFSSMILYHFIRLGPRFRLFAHHQVLIHKEGHDHKGFFKGPWAALNRINSMWVGFFYGSMTGSYSAGHNKIHHRWHNDADDVHSNIDMDRSVFSNYILWLPRFFFYWTGVSCLALFLKRAEYRLAGEILFGQIWWLMGMAFIVKHSNFMFAAAYFMYPMGESIAFLGSMGYLWHSFVQPDDPTNQYINSITILDGKDNIWNEDYHVVHHHAPFVHWSEAQNFYKQTEEKYRECTATIFRDCEEGELIYWIFSSKWDTLAEHFVDLNGKLNHEEKKELLLRRLRYHRLGGFHDDESASWGTGEIRDWDTTSKEEQDAKLNHDEKLLSKKLATAASEDAAFTGNNGSNEVPVSDYVDTFIDTVMNGTGEPLNSHFAPRYEGQPLNAALDKHEVFLALQAEFKEGDRLLDVGCQDGRVARSLARSLKAATTIVGVNSDAEQVARCRRYDNWSRLGKQISYVDSLKAIGDSSVDGAFSIEAFARTSRDAADKDKVFGEIFRSLKPGSAFVGYEWVLTDAFDSNNEEHKKLRQQIEMLSGLAAPLQTSSKLLASLKSAGFSIEESFDVAEQYEKSSAKTVPWYSSLEGDYNSYASFKNTFAGRLFIKSFITFMEAVNCAPKGTSDNISRQEDKDNTLIKAGRLGIVSPCYFFRAVKKN